MRYSEQEIGEFLSAVASRRVTPAGGSATAVAGALGASLCEMACIHTSRDDGPASDGGSATVGTRRSLERARTRLLELAASDADVVDELFGSDAAGSDPRVSKRAIGIPLAVAETCLHVLDGAETVTALSDQAVVTDAVIGAQLVHAALEAAVFTVRANAETVPDDSFVTEVTGRVEELSSAGEAAFERVLANAATP